MTLPGLGASKAGIGRPTPSCALVPDDLKINILKVVGNEKNERSGRSQMLRYDAGPWRSRFIYSLNMQFLSKMFYFLFRL